MWRHLPSPPWFSGSFRWSRIGLGNRGAGAALSVVTVAPRLWRWQMIKNKAPKVNPAIALSSIILDSLGIVWDLIIFFLNSPSFLTNIYCRRRNNFVKYDLVLDYHRFYTRPRGRQFFKCADFSDALRRIGGLGAV